MSFDSVKLDIRDSLEKDDSSEKDNVRTEEPWNEFHETYFESIIEECKRETIRFQQSSMKNKFYYKIFSIPVVVLPISVSILNKYFTESYEFIRVMLLLLSGMLSGVNMFLNFSKKEQLFGEYSNKYKELQTIIEFQLTKKKRYRLDVDVFSERIKQVYLELNKNSPN